MLSLQLALDIIQFLIQARPNLLPLFQQLVSRLLLQFHYLLLKLVLLFVEELNILLAEEILILRLLFPLLFQLLLLFWSRRVHSHQ